MTANGRAAVVVLGGGISGLSAAFRLTELSTKNQVPLEVTLLERGQRIGGPLLTIREHGFIAEAGSDSLLTEKPWALDLARRLGLENKLIGTRDEFRRTYAVRGGKLVAIPEGFALLAPARVGPVLRSSLLSPFGKMRIAMEPLIPRRREESDESLAAFVRRRLGREVLERIAQPLAGGIYTADPETLSIGATLPRFVDLERRYGSVVRGLRAAARARGAKSHGASGARWGLFASFSTGIQTLADALAQRLGQTVRRGVEAVALERIDAGTGPESRQPRWRVVAADGTRLEADAIVCALPTHRAAPLLAPHSAELSRALAAITYASAAVVNTAYRIEDFPHAPDGVGFVVPAVERRRIIAGSFTSLKYAGRAPEGTVLLRAFIGGALQHGMLTMDDGAMVDVTRDEFEALLGIKAAPIWTHVQRWPESMPQYSVGHLDRVAMIERASAQLPGIALAGAALRGVGIPDCVHSGERAAETVFATFGAPR